MTLTMAVVVHLSLFAQTGPQSGGAKAGVLTREDSLVLAEAGGGMMQGGGSRAEAGGAMARLSPADSLALTDSLTRADSLLRTRERVLSFPAAIDAILGDFPYNLRHVTGELVLAQGEFENYASMVSVPGAQSCIVTRYHSADDTTASWQAKMFSSDDYDLAARQYQELFRKLKTCYVRLVDGSIINLEGVWEPAREGTSFTTSTLRLMTGDWRYKEVKVELELVYQLADWAVNINIVSKKRDDEVGGGTAVENQ
jgi:hypothetical protein